MSEKKLPKATHKGMLKIGDAEIPCFVLEDGRRVISGRGMTSAIGMKGRGQGIARIASHRMLEGSKNSGLAVAIENPIKFTGRSPKIGVPSDGYEATVLQELCEAVLSARDIGLLKTEQEIRYGQHADMLMRSFARVGIIALIDEATGYQYDRDKDDLQRLLALYLSEERLKWAKMFPDEYYRHLFRLKGWAYHPLSVKRPKLVGKLTNQLVYEKLPPGVLPELRRLNPVVNKKTWRRETTFTSHLSPEIGQKDLRDHLLQLVAVMRISANWRDFLRNFARAFPGPGGYQQELGIDETDD